VDAILSHASDAYVFAFFGTMIVVALLERVAPLRQPADTQFSRRLANAGIALIDNLVVRVLFPVLGTGWAAVCRARGWGVFNQLGWAGWPSVVLAVVALDAVLYLQHYLSHRVPLLWRLHRTHHTDRDFDLTTNIRTHPFEAILNSGVLMGAIAVLGAPPVGVLLFQVFTIAMAWVDHANLSVPSALDRALRWIVVTPDMHRVHHSEDPREGNANLANLFSWWDRIFGTYVDQPAAGHEGMTFGVAGFSARKHQTLPWMLLQPFLGPRER
jgi:sterol desaturase/sphingolipid hydroxylase (fatty acid hydroxylase superfamily)